MNNKRVRVVGIDPGSISCGYGIVEKDSRKRLIHISSGTIELPRNNPLEVRLKLLYLELKSILQRFEPVEAAIEKIFFALGVKAALHLGHARGVVLLAISEIGINLYEYSPNEVKKAVVGYGKAQKIQVQQMIKTILSLKELPSPDAADALALAVCHLNTELYNQ